MLTKNQTMRLAGLALSLTIVASLAHYVEGQDELAAYHEGMKDLFPNDPEVKKLIEQFLDNVPSSHKSRNHANRFFGHKKLSKRKSKHHVSDEPQVMDKNYDPGYFCCPKETKKLNLVRQADSYDNEVKKCIGKIFKMYDKKCHTCEEWPCPEPREEKCPPMEDVCKLEGTPCMTCAPCPLPEYCEPPPPKEKCPPPPVCPSCEVTTTTPLPTLDLEVSPLNITATNTTNTSSNTGLNNSTITSSNTSSSTSSNFTSNANSSINQNTKGVPNEVIDDLLFVLTAQVNQTTEKPVTITTASNSSTQVITHTPTTCPPCPCMTTSAPLIMKVKTVGPTVAPTAPPTAKPISSLATGKLTKDFSTEKEHQQTGNNFTSHESSQFGTKTVSNSSFSSSTKTKTQGGLKFEKNLELMVGDKEQRQHILDMLEATPAKTGGNLMALGSVLLAKLGDPLPAPVKGKRGAGRTFSYVNSRHCFKSVMGHLLDEYRRKRCFCKSCVVTRKLECKCDPKACPSKLPLCSSCPKAPACPAPKGCPTYPPCKSCRTLELDDFNFDGNEADLDDVDPENPVTNDNEVVPCKGITCPFEKDCGKAPLNPLTPKQSQSGYMVGGENEIYGEWPSFVRIDIQTKEGLSGLCGGVLITHKHVLTAGHCVALPPKNTKHGTNYTRLPLDAFSVIVADHDRHNKDKFEMSRTLEKICYSSKFNDPKLEGSRYDFAVLTLNQTVPFDDHIQPACLPYEAVGKSDKCFVVGLGITQFEKTLGNHTFPEIIQKMPLKRVSCKNWGIKHNDRSRQCFTKAGGKGDTCGGDSGGPVLCKNKNRWVVNGLVSYGSETCDGSETSGWVAVYTRLHALMNQITNDCLAAERPIRKSSPPHSAHPKTFVSARRLGKRLGKKMSHPH